MNRLLQVKLRFQNEKNRQRPRGRNLRAQSETTSEKIDGLVEDLNAVIRYFQSVPKIVDGILVDCSLQ